MKRRDALILLASGTAAGVGALLLRWRWRDPAADAGEQELPERLPNTMLPSPPGRLGPEDRKAMWELCRAIGRRWGMEGLTEVDFQGVLDLKTDFAPSYLAEYRNAVQIDDRQRSN